MGFNARDFDDFMDRLDKDGVPKILQPFYRDKFLSSIMHAIEGQQVYGTIGNSVNDDQVGTGDYAILGISNNSNKNQVNKAFRSLSKKYHPDNQETGNEIAMKNINVAKGNIYEDRGWSVKL